MNIFKKIPAVIASVAVIVSLSAVAVSANSYVPEVSDVVTEDIEVVFDSATKAQREQEHCSRRIYSRNLQGRKMGAGAVCNLEHKAFL